ncbi:MAG: hypothetical protein N2Z63_10005 [Thiobacillaceae bacterium]|nr:hypothetical protein [Thiobacillaceae bacterium]
MGATAVPAQGADGRIPIMVSASEHDRVLEEMRVFLHGLHNIFHALSRRDMKSVAVEAAALGREGQTMPAALRNRLPVAYMEMARGLHEVFDAIARDATAKADPFHTLGQLGEAVSYCSGCHDTYRFQIGRITRSPDQR